MCPRENHLPDQRENWQGIHKRSTQNQGNSPEKDWCPWLYQMVKTPSVKRAARHQQIYQLPKPTTRVPPHTRAFLETKPQPSGQTPTLITPVRCSRKKLICRGRTVGSNNALKIRLRPTEIYDVVVQHTVYFINHRYIFKEHYYGYINKAIKSYCTINIYCAQESDCER